MNNEYKINHTVKYSEVDSNYNMRLDHIVSYFQDITGLHSFEMEIDNETMLKLSNAFWVVTKMKLIFHRFPRFQENIVIETWPTTFKGVRFGRDYVIYSKENVLISCRSEWCTLDFDSKRPRRVESVHYPHSMPHRLDNSNSGEFYNVKEEINDKDYSHTHKVLLTDIDANNHTNNIAYIRMALDSFSLEESKEMNVKEFQISYLNQSFYDDEIKIYKKKKEYGYYLEELINNKTIFTLLIII